MYAVWNLNESRSSRETEFIGFVLKSIFFWGGGNVNIMALECEKIEFSTDMSVDSNIDSRFSISNVRYWKKENLSTHIGTTRVV